VFLFFQRFTLLLFYWKEKTIPQHATAAIFESFRWPEQRRIGFRVGVREYGEDEEEKFATLFEGLGLFLARFYVCFFAGQVSCGLRLGVVDEGRTSFFFELVLRCAMNKDIPASLLIMLLYLGFLPLSLLTPCLLHCSTLLIRRVVSLSHALWIT
jgi:hypothetical protein